jgi:hypothetical protein
MESWQQPQPDAAVLESHIMRVLCLLFSLAIAASPAVAQQQTLVSGRVESGGFGAPVVKFAQVAGQSSVYFGGRGGWIINHSFVLGAAAYGLASDVRLDPRFFGRQLEFGYGGMDLEFVIAPNSIIHASFSTLLGGGGVRPFYEPVDVVFVVEPQLNIALNVAPFMRMVVGGSYLWVTDVDTPSLRPDDLSSFTGSFQVQFGSF